MWSNSMSAMGFSGRSVASATAALRALVAGPLTGFLRLDLLTFLQLARERAIGAVHHRVALVHPAEGLHVGAAGDPGLHPAHPRHPVLFDPERHPHPPG